MNPNFNFKIHFFKGVVKHWSLSQTAEVSDLGIQKLEEHDDNF